MRRCSGSNDIANLYPEKANAHPGYHVKDTLENKLHDLVCDGTMTLRSVQMQIVANLAGALSQGVWSRANRLRRSPGPTRPSSRVHREHLGPAPVQR